jgi:hypothetical protein
MSEGRCYSWIRPGRIEFDSDRIAGFTTVALQRSEVIALLTGRLAMYWLRSIELHPTALQEIHYDLFPLYGARRGSILSRIPSSTEQRWHYDGRR